MAAVDDLRALHVPGSPLLLANAWDATSAALVERSGFPAIATSSAAVARVLGSEDHEHMTADEALGAARRIIDAVTVPVTVDFEAGYGLAPDAIAYGLLEIGAAGCNLEDSDHRSPGTLVDADVHVARLTAVRAAAGDALVLNARVDSFARGLADARHIAIDRGKRYLDAGADCIYPITASDEGDIAALVEALGVININLGPASPTLARLAELGVARVSTASGLHRVMTRQVGAVLAALRDGDDSAFREQET